MAAPTLAAPLATGVMDSGRNYTIVMASQNATSWGLNGAAPTGWVANFTDNVVSLSFSGSGISDATAIMAGNVAFSLPLQATNGDGSTNQTWPLVLHQLNAQGGQLRAIGTRGSDAVIVVSYLLAAGLEVGTILWLGATATAPTGSLVQIGSFVSMSGWSSSEDYPWNLGYNADVCFALIALSSGGGDDPGSIIGTLGDQGDLEGGVGGPPAAYIVAVQYDEQQGDITSAASDSGTRGVAYDYEIDTTDAGIIRVQGAPLGLGLDLTGTPVHLKGTPVEMGLFAVMLRAGAMQRYLMLTIEAGDWDSVITGSASVSSVAGLNFSYQPSTTLSSPVWSLSGGTSGMTIDAGTGLVAGIFTDPGTYILTISVLSGLDVATLTVTVTVTAAPPASALLWLPWLHSDLTLVDLQWDLRARTIQSYYANAGALNFTRGEDAKFAVVLWNAGDLFAAVTSLELVIKIASTTTDYGFDDGPLLEDDTLSLVTVGGGNFYYTAPLTIGGDPIEDALDALAKSSTLTPLTCALQLKLVTTGDVKIVSRPLSVVIADAYARD